MTTDEIIKTYLAIAASYVVAKGYGLIKKKDGMSGWSRLKQEAVKKDLYMPGAFVALAFLVLMYNAATWPFSLARIVLRGAKSK